MPNSGDPNDGRIDRLMAAWSEGYREMEVPQPADDLEQADEATRAAVDWMQSAWADLEIPAAPMPARLRQYWLPRTSLGRVLSLAAALLLVLIGAWMQATPGELAQPKAEHLASGPSATGSKNTGNTKTQAARDESPLAEALQEVQVSPGLASNNMEFRSGRVTLVLVTGD